VRSSSWQAGADLLSLRRQVAEESEAMDMGSRHMRSASSVVSGTLKESECADVEQVTDITGTPLAAIIPGQWIETAPVWEGKTLESR
jgi:hypothetical protein